MSDIRPDSPVSVLYGIGPEAAKKLEKLDIRTVYDLISYLPRRYNDWSDVKTIDQIENGSEISFYCTVSSFPTRKGYKRTAPISFRVKDETGSIELSFFNMPWIVDKYRIGDRLFVHGMVNFFGMTPQIVNPFIEKLEADATLNNLVRPVYPLTAGITSLQLSKWIKTALKLVIPKVRDVIPKTLSESAGLCTLEESYNFVHFPQNMYEAARGRKRLAYEELILLVIGMKYFIKKDDGKEIAPVVIPGSIDPVTAARWKTVVGNLGFELTEDQKKALSDIQRDLMTDKPMNRLVQGDVGSGKTAVAVLAMAMTALMGKQAVLLAPTSVLATQHYQTAMALLKDSGINVALLLGKTSASLKREIKSQLKNNEASVIIGTHALLSDDISFADLALVIADEQHRFGVKQREKLLIRDDSGILSAANTVHNLVMTATPIPRTLAMVVYGDMDTSIIKQKPAGRKEIETHYLSAEHMPRLADALRSRLAKGEQAYIVCPRIAPNEDELLLEDFLGGADENDSGLMSVKEMHSLLGEWGVTSEYSAEMLYGSMNEKKKLEVMERFLSGETKILISTTVIEVGVNNPEATLMVIMDADRFGLSTLHQLRGRIGRGDKQSYCILVSANKSEMAISRMKMMCETADGFELAGKDLEMRGPGDLFGTRQHGIPTLKAANLYTDMGIASEAEAAVKEILDGDGPEKESLLESLEYMFKLRFGDRMNSL